MSAPDRIACCIPGCRRSFPRARVRCDELMCRRHWLMIDTRIRERHKQLKRRARKIERLFRRKSVQARMTERRLLRLTVRINVAASRTWGLCKQDATIKAALRAEDAPRRRAAA